MTRSKSGRHAKALVVLSALLLALGVAYAKYTKEELQKDLDDFLIEGDWNYDDIGRGLRLGAREGKPVLIVFR